ncbi:MAG: glycosyltransferase [Nitrosomonadales bacterium]|jgi:rSAM/selenodomain-associated transferase 2|nr:MAG: glycosyltransferase [Nitrosomonadales bacterium]
MKISIIIPILNEARRIPQLLEELKPLVQNNCEIIIVDGGSEDGSVEMIEHPGFIVERAGCGRARQMNVGAARATGTILLFLHADTQLPDTADLLVKQALSNNSLSCWGHFNVCIAGRPKMLRVVGFMMNIRSRVTNIATGDQAIFVKKTDFMAAGCFPEQLLMEDIELSKKLRIISRPTCINSYVITSGRRWEVYGVWRTIFLMWRLRWDYWRGIPASQLAGRYQ